MPAENVVLHKLEEVNKSVKVEPFSPFQYVSFSMMPCRKPKKRFSEIDVFFFFITGEEKVKKDSCGILSFQLT